MKKNYNQPQIQVMALMPTTIICASVTEGAGGTAVNGNSGGDTIGD